MAIEHANWPSGYPQPPSELPTDFKTIALPGTDIWRKPPQTYSFNAPISYRRMKLSTFHRARVTVSANWKTLYDQGGICLIMEQAPGSLSKWVKTGVEFYDGRPHISTVACDRWADWSLLPTVGTAATVELEREVVDGKPTSTLWVYALEGVERRPVREITWVFDSDSAPSNDEAWIGVYAAKPTKDGDNDSRALEVSFSNFVVETF